MPDIVVKFSYHFSLSGIFFYPENGRRRAQRAPLCKTWQSFRDRRWVSGRRLGVATIIRDFLEGKDGLGGSFPDLERVYVPGKLCVSLNALELRKGPPESYAAATVINSTSS